MALMRASATAYCHQTTHHGHTGTLARTTTTIADTMADNRAGGRIPYGYRPISEEVHHRGEEETEQQRRSIIKRGHEAGLRLRKIAVEITSKGYPTRTGRVFSAKS